MQIGENPRLPHAVSFTANELDMLRYIPPTEDCLDLALELGGQLGSALARGRAEEGDLPPFQVVDRLMRENNFPISTSLQFMNGVLGGMERGLKTVETVRAIHRFGAVISVHRGQLAHELEKRQRELVDELSTRVSDMVGGTDV